MKKNSNIISLFHVNLKNKKKNILKKPYYEKDKKNDTRSILYDILIDNFMTHAEYGDIWWYE